MTRETFNKTIMLPSNTFYSVPPRCSQNAKLKCNSVNSEAHISFQVRGKWDRQIFKAWNANFLVLKLSNVLRDSGWLWRLTFARKLWEWLIVHKRMNWVKLRNGFEENKSQIDCSVVQLNKQNFPFFLKLSIQDSGVTNSFLKVASITDFKVAQ